MKDINNAKSETVLKRYISPFGAWALSFGCIVGWGAFIMPGTTFLNIAGPLSSAIGMAAGALIICVIAVNYSFMMKRCPDPGGTFTYAYKVFGYDHGFLSAWFMILAYFSILWANISAIPLVARYLFGDALKFGFLYKIADYDIYLGEVLVELGVLFAFGAICIISKKASGIFQMIFAVLLFGGIVAGFILTGVCRGEAPGIPEPMFQPDNGAAAQIFGIVALAPWAFVGFESVSNSTEEFRFSIKKTLPIMLIAIAAGFISYTLLIFTAASVQPAGFADWTEYIANLGSFSGIEGIPTFYALYSSLGDSGLVILGVALLSAVLTGVIGSMIASSRLIYSMAKEKIMPSALGKVRMGGIPANAMKFIMAISVVIPFLGRTAIGWVFDVITVGTTIAYGYTSAAAFKRAKESGNRKIMVSGIAGIIISVFIGLLLLVPDLLSVNTLSTESYLLLAFWGILGIVFFRFVFKNDKARRLGGSTVVWLALLVLVFFTSLMWVRQNTDISTQNAINNIAEYYTGEMEEHGISRGDQHIAEDQAYLDEEMSKVQNALTVNSIVQMGLIILGLAVIFNIYSIMHKREKEMESEKINAEERSKAKSAFLSNMSHDIRTPMNAIVGYIGLAKDENLSARDVRDYLAKIEVSSGHLLELINDILEMSRIESGKMELDETECDIRAIFGDVKDIFVPQMREKNITYIVSADEITDRYIMCDKSRLNRVLLNLVSNAYKFTPAGGTVKVTLRQTGAKTDGRAVYELAVSDSGYGMTKEFADKVFEAFERERTATVNNIEGTGLGMAITKSIIDLMGGSIRVDTAPGKGTTFIAEFPFRVCEKEITVSEPAGTPKPALSRPDFSGMRVLLVDDVDINREIAAKILRKLGFEVDSAVNGKEAVDMVSASEAGYYDVVLMDLQMPVMDGYTATEKIRSLGDERLASVPIAAMTANAFAEDIAKVKKAGMNAHIAKPIDIAKLIQTLTDLLKK